MTTYGSGTYGAPTGTYGDLVGFVEPATTRIIPVASTRPGRTASSRRGVLVAASGRPSLSVSTMEPEREP